MKETSSGSVGRHAMRKLVWRERSDSGRCVFCGKEVSDPKRKFQISGVHWVLTDEQRDKVAPALCDALNSGHTGYREAMTLLRSRSRFPTGIENKVPCHIDCLADWLTTTNALEPKGASACKERLDRLGKLCKKHTWAAIAAVLAVVGTLGTLAGLLLFLMRGCES